MKAVGAISMQPDPQTAQRRSFGELLKRHRAAAGLTQDELAERAELSVRGLRYLERGLRRPYPDTVKRLVDVLALSPQDHATFMSAARSRRPSSAPRVERVGVGVAPAPSGPLIGREREVGAAAGLLRRDDVRVVTLTGPGGVGKTRLALEVAAKLRPAFAGGVVWVPLAALTDSTLVPSAIASALGLVETGALTVLEALRITLRNRQVLLLLDNFEQVVTAAAAVSDLLASCPRLKVLVTSRAVLRMGGEHQFPVWPLTPPALTAGASVFVLAANPAVDLFLRRAQAARPGFALTPSNAAAVAGICRRLEGLPLALELAAARIRVLPPRAMLDRLEHRLTFLTGGAPDVPARQHTMRETIAWSYDLLTPAEQNLFRRLTVFDGGCGLPAIEAVTTQGSDPQLDVLLDGIEAMIHNSLLRLEETDDEEPRFRMLETVRDYGLEQLGASGDEEQLRRRHADYFLSFAEEAARGVYSPATALWLDRLEQDHDNCRAAIRWCIAQRNAEMGLRLAAALWGFWYIRGYSTEGRAQLAVLLALPWAGAGLTAPRAEALLGAGQLALTQGDYATAWTALEESIALFRGVGDERGTAGALLAAGFVSRLQEHYDTASALLHEALGLARATGYTFIAAASLHHLGMIAADVQHDHTAARGLFEESLGLYRILGFPRFIALLLLSLGELAIADGDQLRAHHLLRDSLTTMRDVGERLGIHGALDAYAHLAVTEGRAERAVRLAGAAERLRAIRGTHSWPVEERRRALWLATARETLDGNTFQAAWTSGQAKTQDQAIANALDADR